MTATSPSPLHPDRTSHPVVGAIDAAAAGIQRRLSQLPDLARVEVMAPANAPPAATLTRAQHSLEGARRDLGQQIRGFRGWLRGEGSRASAAEAQRRYGIVRLRWMAVLTQYDIYADALSQRSEHPTGTWLAGLDHLAADALADVPVADRPDVLCYLDRGVGAAIRRARTRLPGGLRNPVSIVRVPRERMVGPGIGSSLVHEIGHQAAALLCLVESLRSDLDARAATSSGHERRGWSLYRRWVSEIVADFWSVGLLGIAATHGLIDVVSLPAPFVFRVSPTDPHPAPWIRVRLSARMGERLHPDPAWSELSDAWAERYPPSGLRRSHARLVRDLDAMTDDVAALMAAHRSTRLGRHTLAGIVPAGRRRPSAMRSVLAGAATPADLARLRPTLALAALGAAPATSDAAVDRSVEHLLGRWATARYRGDAS